LECVVYHPSDVDNIPCKGILSVMQWTVKISNKAAKQYKKLPKSVRDGIDALIKEICIAGPVRGNWPNYSKLADTEHQKR
jgi:mRNA-degrading endonuclease RelE of RelBE toxin-antitoxin system